MGGLGTRHGTAFLVVRWMPWVILSAGAIAARLFSDSLTGRASPTLLLVWTGVFFASLILRIVVATRNAPGRKSVFVALLLGLVLWLTGSSVLALAEASAPVTFPGQGEWLFLSACVCFAAFLFLDGQPTTALRSVTAWVDAVMLTAGAAALAAAVVLPPVSHAYPDSGVAPIAAVIYPVIDFGLALMVIAQWALGTRAGDRRTGLLIAGFVVFTLADTTLVLALPTGTYSFTSVTDVLWAAAFALLVEGACMRARGNEAPLRRRVPRILLMAGFAMALGLLLIRPAGVVGTVIAVSSAIVIAAAGLRLLLALSYVEAAADALHRAAVDDLTGLPSRSAFLRRIEETMVPGRRGGLLVMDVDGFQEVNDALGHAAGDYVLRVLAGRFSEVLPQGALLARVGGDEFGIVVATDDQRVLRELAEAMRSQAALPIGLDGLDLSVRVSVGASWLLPEDLAPTDLVRRAEVALYSASESGSGVEAYRRDDDPFTRERLELANDLREAIRQRHLTVCYLPTIHASTGAVESLEALVRWQHAREGMVTSL